MRILFDWLLRLTRFREAYGLALAFSLLVGFSASEVYRLSMEDDFRQRFSEEARFNAVYIDAQTMRGQEMGAAALSGLNADWLKELALGKRRPDEPESLKRMRAVRLLLDAAGIYVVDAKGIVVAHETAGKRVTGMDISFRPYWQEAMRGRAVVYPALGVETAERGLYVSAPIHSRVSADSPAIGAIVVKTGADDLDRKLAMVGREVMLVSPQGVVFAATDKAWLLRLTSEASGERLEEIRRIRQFGDAIGKAQAPSALPFDLSGETVGFGGRRYARATVRLHWNDPAGEWSLVTLGDLRGAAPFRLRGAVGVFAALLMMALMETVRRTIQYEAARREGVASTEAAAKELAAAARYKSRLSEFTLALQHERDLGSLSATFFGQLASLLPLHQGSLYYIDSIGDDKTVMNVAGTYGLADVPQRIRLGEGLLGQCALERGTLVLSDVPAGFWRVSSGLGEAGPGALMLFPIVSNKDLLGVLEVASLDPGFVDGRDVVESLLPILSMNLEIQLAERLEDHIFSDACAKAEAYKAQQAAGDEVQSWFHMVIDGMSDGILVVDARGRIVLANRAAGVIFGYAAEEMQDLNVEALAPPAEAAPVEKHLVFRAEDERGTLRMNAWRSGLKGLRKDGKEMDLCVSLTSLPETALHGTCVYAVVRPGTMPPAGGEAAASSGIGGAED